MRWLALLVLSAGCDRWSDSHPLKGDDTPSPVDDSGTTDPSDPRPLRPGALARHVIVLVMDGTRMEETFGDPAGWSDAAGLSTGEMMPQVRASLFPEGTLVLPGYNAGITITAPAHCDLVTGQRENFAHYPTSGGAGQYRPTLPTLFELLAGGEAAAEGAYILTGNSEHISPLTRSVYPGATDDAGGTFTLVEGEIEGSAEDSDVTTLAAVRAMVGAQMPELLVANLHGIDRSGHYAQYDHDDDTDTPQIYNPTGYSDHVKLVDDDLPAFWSWIQSDASGLKDTTMLVVMSDHGRHRWGDEAEERLEGDPDPMYKGHGDQCAGCRQIPMFLAGPGIRRGATVTTMYTIEDVSRTIARVLGIAHPYATGLVMNDLFEVAPGGTVRSGVVAPDASGTAAIAQRWTDDARLRSVVEVDGVQLSGDDAFLAEAPRIFQQGSRTFACWRELTLDPSDTAIDRPWTPRCMLRQAGEWTDIGFPEDMVYPLWEAAMATDDAGRLLLAWPDNPNATTYNDTRAWVQLLRWSPAQGWEGAGLGPGAVFPADTSVATYAGAAWVAFARSDLSATNDITPGRYTRHIVVNSVVFAEAGTQVWTDRWRTWNTECPPEARCERSTPTADTDGDTYDRMESPAITPGTSGLDIAFLGFSAAGTTVLHASSDATGASWTAPERLDESGRVFGHIRPRWAGGLVYWARLGDGGTAEVCRAAPRGEADCVDTGSPRIAGLAIDDAGAVASVDTGEATWALTNLSW